MVDKTYKYERAMSSFFELLIIEKALMERVRIRNHKNLLGSCVCFGSFVAILDLCLYM